MSHPRNLDRVRHTGFGLATDMTAGKVSHWHTHAQHQVLFAAQGTMHLEVEGGQWLLPPQRAALIASGVQHRVVARTAVELRTVYLSPRAARFPSTCRVFPVTSLAREMLLHAMRWGPDGNPRDTTAQRYFQALAALVAEWAQEARPWHLPRARSAPLRRAMQYALDALDQTPTLEGAARAAHLSTRSLTRRFQEETQTTWRDFLHHARMLRAMELLATPDCSVTEAALAVGFASLGAFTRAFHAFTGELPREFRRRAVSR
ncbi:MAG: helix-turn-helix transcriptional regulator [Myxococcota bacterium]